MKNRMIAVNIQIIRVWRVEIPAISDGQAERVVRLMDVEEIEKIGKLIDVTTDYAEIAELN